MKSFCVFTVVLLFALAIYQATEGRFFWVVTDIVLGFLNVWVYVAVRESIRRQQSGKK